MKRTTLLLSSLVCFSAVGCAGQLTEDEMDRLYKEHTGGSGGSSTGTNPTTGSGGSGPAVDQCVVNTKALASCQVVGCHSGATLSAGLDLSATAVTTNAKTFLDKANVGTPGVTMPGDATGCPPNMYKLIDKSNPSNSLIYTKAEVMGEMATHPCGGKMPVIGSFTTADKMCILSWINSVINLP
jgi:hypothetical protein